MSERELTRLTRNFVFRTAGSSKLQIASGKGFEVNEHFGRAPGRPAQGLQNHAKRDYLEKLSWEKSHAFQNRPVARNSAGADRVE